MNTRFGNSEDELSESEFVFCNQLLNNNKKMNQTKNKLSDYINFLVFYLKKIVPLQKVLWQK